MEDKKRTLIESFKEHFDSLSSEEINRRWNEVVKKGYKNYSITTYENTIRDVLEDKIREKRDILTYMIDELVKWHKEVTGECGLSGFCNIKILRLTFYIICQSRYLIKEVFNDIYCTPFGMYDAHIYDMLLLNDNKKYESKTFSMCLRNSDYTYCIPSCIKKEIDYHIQSLKNTNREMITYDSRTLNGIGQNWDSFKHYYLVIKHFDKKAVKVDIKDVLEDYTKLFNYY